MIVEELFEKAKKYSTERNSMLADYFMSETIRKALFLAYLNGAGYSTTDNYTEVMDYCEKEFKENLYLRNDCEPVGAKGPMGFVYPDGWDAEPDEGYINVYYPNGEHGTPWTDGNIYDDHRTAEANVPEEYKQWHWGTTWIHWCKCPPH